MATEWFEAWFNSPYYPILYQKRDEREAAFFLENLLDHLQPAPEARFLDLACGTGRHSIFLAQKGFTVTGLDIAENKIKKARQHEGERLSFFMHDMRHPFRIHYFDYILNLFTSFGYFEREKDHLDTLINVRKGLREGGKFVLDFFNAEKTIRQLIPEEEKQIDELHFLIHKEVQKGFIIKRIRVEDKDEQKKYEERVRAYTLAELSELFANAGLEILEVFGDYGLTPFNAGSSDRLILVAGEKQP
jgi:SAM-dependent methyltransferase